MKSFFLETDGNGLWSEKSRKVKICNVELGVYTSELRLFFTQKTWDTEKYGLIYTDRKFIKQFRNYLVEGGVPKEIANDIDYTEQGMQGDNYVSLEFGGKTQKYLLKKLLGEKW